mmetsp:Transcript_6531/g.15098  ORF Transcript_6531/g.15098 Transcript_6531/m.15098 type:complete len:83 (-) Transcript_6531:317-565(-)
MEQSSGTGHIVTSPFFQNCKDRYEMLTQRFTTTMLNPCHIEVIQKLNELGWYINCGCRDAQQISTIACDPSVAHDPRRKFVE